MAERTYRIGEAASLLNLKTYVLRFWETEFPQLVPLRTEKGQRLYTEADLALLRRIRFLLHERGLTIEGARRMLAERGAAPAPDMSDLPGDDDSPADADAILSASASRVQAWDQYLHGLLLPEEGEPVPTGDRDGDADPQSAEAASGSGATSGTVREIIAELEAMRRLLAGAD